jgi:hypothetical protein
MRVRVVIVVVAGLLMAALPALAQSPSAAVPSAGSGPVVVASGLDSPRGVSFGPDGALYVAEAGEGGEGPPCYQHPTLGTSCYGLTGGVTRIDLTAGTSERVMDQLPSALAATDILGPSDVAVGDTGELFVTIGLGTDPALRAGLGSPYTDLVGWVTSNTLDAQIADISGFELANNPDGDQPGSRVASNPNSLALKDGAILVADAGANTMLRVEDGAITVVAVFPIRFVDEPPSPPDPEESPSATGASPDQSSTALLASPSGSPGAEQIPMQPVPTSVAIGPDGAAYVGLLTGYPFPVGGASVMRIENDRPPTVYAEGFTNVIDLAFGPDGTLYVLEIAHNGLLTADGVGGLWSVQPGGGDPVFLTDELLWPGGVAVDSDGAVYVAQCTVCPNEGTVVRLGV